MHLKDNCAAGVKGCVHPHIARTSSSVALVEWPLEPSNSSNRAQPVSASVCARSPAARIQHCPRATGKPQGQQPPMYISSAGTMSFPGAERPSLRLLHQNPLYGVRACVLLRYACVSLPFFAASQPPGRAVHICCSHCDCSTDRAIPIFWPQSYMRSSGALRVPEGLLDGLEQTGAWPELPV